MRGGEVGKRCSHAETRNLLLRCLLSARTDLAGLPTPCPIQLRAVEHFTPEKASQIHARHESGRGAQRVGGTVGGCWGLQMPKQLSPMPCESSTGIARLGNTKRSCCAVDQSQRLRIAVTIARRAGVVVPGYRPARPSDASESHRRALHSLPDRLTAHSQQLIRGRQVPREKESHAPQPQSRPGQRGSVKHTHPEQTRRQLRLRRSLARRLGWQITWRRDVRLAQRNFLHSCITHMRCSSTPQFCDYTTTR